MVSLTRLNWFTQLTPVHRNIFRFFYLISNDDCLNRKIQVVKFIQLVMLFCQEIISVRQFIETPIGRLLNITSTDPKITRRFIVDFFKPARKVGAIGKTTFEGNFRYRPG